MKKALLVFSLALALALTACSSGVDQATHDAVVKENEELKAKIDEIESKEQESVIKAQESNGNYDELKALADQRIAEIDRDIFWLGVLMDNSAIIMNGIDDESAVKMIEAKSSIQANAFTYKAEMLTAAASLDKDRIEATYKLWSDSIESYPDKTTEFFELINKTLKE